MLCSLGKVCPVHGRWQGGDCHQALGNTGAQRRNKPTLAVVNQTNLCPLTLGQAQDTLMSLMPLAYPNIPRPGLDLTTPDILYG